MTDEVSPRYAMSPRLSRRAFLTLGSALVGGAKAAASSEPKISGVEVTPFRLQCEYRDDPLGIDAAAPRLSWLLSGHRRGDCQAAYQVLVASSPEKLAKNMPDLWDSGKIQSSNSGPISYGGKGLTSRCRCYWKLRVWNAYDDKPSEWSAPAVWTMGLLKPTDWTAHWIADPVLADPSNLPKTPINCYRSEISRYQNSGKWIIVDLEAASVIDGVRISPARRENENTDFRTLLYPVRFTFETANKADFSDAKLVVDKTKIDLIAPRTNIGQTDIYSFEALSARYVRLSVTKLALWDGADYAFALGRFQVFGGGQDIAENKPVSCSDSIENTSTSKSFLTNPTTSVDYAPLPSILNPRMGGVDSVSRVPMIRREFMVKSKVAKATLYCASRGFYELWLNGKRVGEDQLAGGYTQYNRRIQYQTYDVASLVTRGQNAIGTLLGYAWYAGHMNLAGNEYISGFYPQFLGQLEIEYSNGSREVINSDESWKSTIDGPGRWADILDGYGYDCRKEMPGWSSPRFDDSTWKSVDVIPRDDTPLVWQRAQPVREISEIAPISVKQVAPETYVYDFGQEISGWCRLKADGPAGTFIKLRHAEKRTVDGSIDTSNLWGSAAEEDYILDGKGPRTLEPKFSWHGFRFAELSGLPNPPDSDTITMTAVHVRTAAPVAGHFHCSNDLYNKLMTASLWTQQNMMFDVPTGCAGRSERVSWTGDIRPCVQSALLHFDSIAFFEKHAAELRANQTELGRFTDVCPRAHLDGTDICVGSPGWADAGISLPWQLYIHTGDVRILSDHYEAAKFWVDYISSNNPDFLWTNALGMSWGDWLSAGTATPLHVGSTAFYANDADLLSRMARILGKNDDAENYGQLFKNIRAAFAAKFVASDGTIGDPPVSSMSTTSRTDVQGSYALALCFGLLDDRVRSQSAERLLEIIKLNGGHPGTGFWSSVELMLSLTEIGSHDVAARMMNLSSVPSWGYMVQGDGTTCWESFDADKQNLSLNHWTHSAIAEWLWRHVAGIAPDSDYPGYVNTVIRPRPSSEVSSCTATYESPKGHIAVSWSNDESSGFALTVTVPVNATATVYMPSNGREVKESGKNISLAEGVKLIGADSENTTLHVGSGIYKFTC